jgi:hypothetical protein
MKAIGIQLAAITAQAKVLDLKINVVRDSASKIISGLVVGNTLEQNKL